MLFLNEIMLGMGHKDKLLRLPPAQLPQLSSPLTPKAYHYVIICDYLLYITHMIVKKVSRMTTAFIKDIMMFH